MIINNATIVDEDGYRSGKQILISDERIMGVYDNHVDNLNHEIMLDGTGRIVIPGIVNSHAHGITRSPLFSSGAAPLDREQVKSNTYRHLSEGTTTILSVDGFGIPDDTEEHEMNIKTSTTHYPTAFESAELADGAGITGTHNSYRVSNMLDSGAIIIGEVGSGATLGGGVQDYMYIPQLIYELSSKRITEKQARMLKEAVLGREINVERYDEKRFMKLLYDIGIDYEPEILRRSIEQSVLPPFEKSIKSIADAAKLSEEYGVQIAVHHAAASKDAVEKISYLGDRLIASHSNHPSFEPDEALRQAEKLKNRGVIIDIGTFDSLYAGNQDEIELFSMFISEGLADVISTDYGGGNHDGILMRLNDLDAHDDYKISLATSRPAELVDGLAPERGYVRKGYVADLVLVDKYNIGNVDKVLISGKICIDNSKQ